MTIKVRIIKVGKTYNHEVETFKEAVKLKGADGVWSMEEDGVRYFATELRVAYEGTAFFEDWIANILLRPRDRRTALPDIIESYHKVRELRMRLIMNGFDVKPFVPATSLRTLVRDAINQGLSEITNRKEWEQAIEDARREEYSREP